MTEASKNCLIFFITMTSLLLLATGIIYFVEKGNTWYTRADTEGLCIPRRCLALSYVTFAFRGWRVYFNNRNFFKERGYR